MHVRKNRKFLVLLVKPNSLFIPCTLLNTDPLILFSPTCMLVLLIYNPVFGEAAHICTLSSPALSYCLFFFLHLCLFCWHGNPVVWWSSLHYEQCQIMLLRFWTDSLFSNLKLDGIDSTVTIFVYIRAKHVISLLVSGWYA